VPLFIEELTKVVIESGLLVESGDRYLAASPVAPLAIPTSLQASLLARLDRLAPTRDVAQIAAALGRQFSHELLSAVAEMPSEQLDDALAQLVRAELLFRRGTPPDAEYIFKHALVQDAAYGTMLRGRRHQLHARIAATLEDQFPEIVAAQPALLARHCAEAGLAEKAVVYWLNAGQQALARSAMTEAVAPQLHRDIVPLLADFFDLLCKRQRQLVLLSGAARCYLGEFVAARALLEQYHGLSDPAHRVIGVGGSEDAYAVMLSYLAITLAYLGYIDKSRSRLNEALSEAHRLRQTPIGRRSAARDARVDPTPRPACALARSYRPHRPPKSLL
jgi:hypothetical protein